MDKICLNKGQDSFSYCTNAQKLILFNRLFNQLATNNPSFGCKILKGYNSRITSVRGPANICF